MARKQVNGTLQSIGATFGTVSAITAATNATESVFTLAVGHGITVGKWFEVLTSGWNGIVSRVYRAKTVVTNDVTVEGLNTTSTSAFPAGQGVGTVRLISTFVPIQQVLRDGFTITGGDPKEKISGYIDNDLDFVFYTGKTPIKVEMKVDDDQSLAFWTTVRAAEAAATNYPLLVTYSNGGGFAAATGVWVVSPAPEMVGDDVHKRMINIALGGRFTEYQT